MKCEVMCRKLQIGIVLVLAMGLTSLRVLSADIVVPKPTTPEKKGPYAVFFAIHMEANELSHGEYQKEQWPNLVKLVQMAEKYDAKLTLMFNPQWAEYILKDQDKFNRVKEWQKAGHEVALHYHNIDHNDWNGYTNRKDKRFIDDPKYRGEVSEMMKLVQRLADPDRIMTMCMGPDRLWDSLEKIEIDEVDYPDSIVYDADGMDMGLNKVLKTRFKDREIFHVKHHFFAGGRREEHLNRLKEEFQKAGPAEIVGAVTHEGDFGRDPEIIKKWFKFVFENKINIRTIREIIKIYPNEKIMGAEWIKREKLNRETGMSKSGIFDKVRQFHAVLREKKTKGIDTSKAEELDRQSREAANRNDLEKAERLLDEAIKLLKKASI